jgi:hypothetical protein
MSDKRQTFLHGYDELNSFSEEVCKVSVNKKKSSVSSFLFESREDENELNSFFAKHDFAFQKKN